MSFHFRFSPCFHCCRWRHATRRSVQWTASPRIGLTGQSASRFVLAPRQGLGVLDLKSGFASRTFDLAKVFFFLALQISQHHGRQRVRWRSMWCVDTISGGQGDGHLVQQWCVFHFYRSPHKLMDKGNTTTKPAVLQNVPDRNLIPTFISSIR